MPDDLSTPRTATGSRRDAAMAALADVPNTPGASKPDPILVADGVTRRFGGLTVLGSVVLWPRGGEEGRYGRQHATIIAGALDRPEMPKHGGERVENLGKTLLAQGSRKVVIGGGRVPAQTAGTALV